MPVSGPILLTLAITAAAASAGLAVMSAQQQAKTTSAIAEANAEQFKREAKQREFAGAERQKQILEERRRILARNRAKFGKAGVTMEGSPLLVQQEVAKNITQDAVMANYNTQIGVAESKFQAGISLAKASAARTAGQLQVGQALFSGAGQIAGIGIQAELAKNA